ncbi:hypothetical protein ABZP36_004761 [Zizania latifolia]
MAGCYEAKPLASMEEEARIEKKYGGIAPKKPLISKDHERAYFDSADWVLGKVGDKSSVQYSGMECIHTKSNPVYWCSFSKEQAAAAATQGLQERLIVSSLLVSQPSHLAETRGITLQQLETLKEHRSRWARISV